MRLIEAYSYSGYGGKTLRRQHQPLGVAEYRKGGTMGKRSKAPETSADVDGLPLSWFNAEIKRCLYGYENGGSSQGRK
jgi:hypothetical protein